MYMSIQWSVRTAVLCLIAVAGFAMDEARAKDNVIPPASVSCRCYCSRVTGERMEVNETIGACPVGITGKECRTGSDRAGLFEGCKQCQKNAQTGAEESCIEIGGSAREQGPGGTPPKPPKPRPIQQPRPKPAPKAQ
jgi:hypothetical protein